MTYEGAATQELTSADMMRAFSVTYGVATGPVAEKNPTAIVAYGGTEEAVAFWENSQDSMTLSRSPLSNAFHLVVFSKKVNGQADAAIASAVRQEREDAPQREAARTKKRGRHGRRDLNRFLMGSVAEFVVRHAPCSVEVVRNSESKA